MKAKVKELYYKKIDKGKVFHVPYSFFVYVYGVTVFEWDDENIWYILEFVYHKPMGEIAKTLTAEYVETEFVGKKILLDIEDKGQAIREGAKVYNWLKEHSDNQSNQLDYSKLNISVQSL